MRKTLTLFAFALLCPLLMAQQALNNDGVIKLVKAGLNESLIIDTINASPANYDTSANGLIALKNAGLDDKEIAAILAKSKTEQPSASKPAVAPNLGADPRIFIEADPQIGPAIAAAFAKKHVPATVVTTRSDADFVLKSAPVNAKQETAGSKFARCLFADCIGIEGTSSVSVQLINPSDESVVWAYQVRKANGGPGGIQSLSEAIAKHLKNDYLNKRK